jgi:hypothetical protein
MKHSVGEDASPVLPDDALLPPSRGLLMMGARHLLAETLDFAALRKTFI